MGEQKRERLDDYEQGAWVTRVLTVAVVAAVATAAAVGVSLIWPGGIQAHVTECGLNARGPFAVVDLTTTPVRL